jgi:hypothetical protein
MGGGAWWGFMGALCNRERSFLQQTVLDRSPAIIVAVEVSLLIQAVSLY